MKILKKLLLVSTFAATFGVSTLTHASLIGDTINVTGNFITPSSAQVGNANEFSISNRINFNFDATTLTISTPDGAYTWGNLGTYVFTGFSDTITGMVVGSTQNFGSGYADFVEDFIVTANSITFKLSGGSTQNKNSNIVFNISSTPSGTPSGSAPEPATVALFGLGLLGFAAARRKSAKSRTA